MNFFFVGSAAAAAKIWLSTEKKVFKTYFC